jgi:hypothetical protein
VIAAMATDTNFPLVAASFDSIFPSLFGMVFWYDQQLQEMQNYSFIKFQPLAATTCRII